MHMHHQLKHHYKRGSGQPHPPPSQIHTLKVLESYIKFTKNRLKPPPPPPPGKDQGIIPSSGQENQYKMKMIIVHLQMIVILMFQQKLLTVPKMNSTEISKIIYHLAAQVTKISSAIPRNRMLKCVYCHAFKGIFFRQVLLKMFFVPCRELFGSVSL